jgi:hypothetical protein
MLIRRRVPIDALVRTIAQAGGGPRRRPVSSAVEDGSRRRLDVEDAEQEQQNDQEPRHAEDPEQQRDHVRLLSLLQSLGQRESHPGGSAADLGHSGLAITGATT